MSDSQLGAAIGIVVLVAAAAITVLSVLFWWFL